MTRQLPPARIESRWRQAGPWRLHARVSVEPVPADAPVAVLVHGLGVSSRYMVPLAARLAGFCRAEAVDLPGHGLSTKPDRPLGLDGLADALAAFLEAAGLRRAALVGNSYGCQIIAACAVRHPERVERVVLQGPTMDPAARSPLVAIVRWRRDSRYEPDWQGRVILRDYLDCGPSVLLREFRDMLADRIEARLPAIQVPALVVRGGLDPIVPQRWAEEVTRLLPRGRLVVIPGVPHTVNSAAPLEFMRVVRPFLLGSPAAGGREAA